ncbi:glycosyltransferase family 61 protein [Roseicyclus marinus]|uniref:glycosyltransferase family 61 protein n=1 Tax=Roseicyclus marinus TaxID=2161673 RepID=UPI0024103178|nr:glycosyltransferase family 61 protein [Roseicyclus marinus]MDG3042909.1 glycosyltransferase family 61 protein [Roseicyclus marinus]
MQARPIFDPARSRADSITTLHAPLIWPVTYHPKNHSPRPGGVIAADGSYLDLSHCHYTTAKRWTLPCAPDPEVPVTDLPGTWLYGGVLDPAFGHCIIESLSRLWVLDHLDSPPDGIVFLPAVHRTFYQRPKRYLAATAAVFDSLDGLPARRACPTQPVRPERLIMGAQGMGGGDFSAGSPEFRAFMQRHFLPDVAPSGGENLYVSRARLSVMGNIMFEDRIEALFAANGYEIFYPEEHSLAEQTARYRAARRIVTVEGSALHVIAYALGPDRPVEIGIIPRRTTDNTASFEAQLRWQSAAQVHVTGALTRLYHPGRIYGEQSNVRALHDLRQLADQLASTGLIEDASAIENPTEAEIDAALAALPKQMVRMEV